LQRLPKGKVTVERLLNAGSVGQVLESLKEGRYDIQDILVIYTTKGSISYRGTAMELKGALGLLEVGKQLILEQWKEGRDA